MNYYQSGLHRSVRGHHVRGANYHRGAREVIGFRLVNSPGYLLDEINRLDAEISSTDTDLQAFLSSKSCAYHRDATSWSDPLAGDAAQRWVDDDKAVAANPGHCATITGFYDGPWSSFVIGWRDFKDKHDAGGITGWYERFWGSLMETIDTYRDSLRVMRDAAKAAGFALASPDPVNPPAGMFDSAGRALSGIGDLLKTVLYTVLIVGGAVALIWALGALRHGGSLGGGGRLLVVGK
jgi:hypothetical protein